jgi:DNA primase
MGTALTDKHFEILQAWEIKKIELWLDYDEAGLKAGFKHGLEAFRRGFDVEIVLAKEKGKDPADIFVGNATKRTLSIQKYIIAYLKKYVKELDKEKIITWAKEQRLKKKQVEALMQVIGYDMEEEVDNYEYENPYANPTPLELSYASIVKATLKEHPEFLNTTWEEIAPYPVITGEVIHDKREFLKVFFAWADMHHTRLYSLAVLNGDTEAMKEEEKILEKIHNAMRKEG